MSPGVARLSACLPPALLVVAAVLAYANSLDAPFVFDDLPSIEENITIRRLWPLGDVLQPPAGSAGVAGRPVVNLSLALNYAAGGLDPRGYRALNIALHALAGLALFGLMRRVLAGPVLGPRHAAAATPFAFAVALLWTVHPLQTESVTCVIQRTELLGSLFSLLTLYCLARAAGTGARASTAWQLAGIGACLLGIASKETVATAPVLAFLLDRTFFAGSFAAAWRARRWFYCGLVLTWLPLLHLVAGNPMRGGAAGFDGAISVWHYLLTQAHALTLYLKLTFWPHPLVLDYGTFTVSGLADVWPEALLVLVLLAATALALRRWPVAGFCGAAFFLILAPSSSIVPLLTQTIAEHRMHLPLAPVLALLLSPLLRANRATLVLVIAPLAVASLVLTVARNRDYRTAEGIWLDTVAKRPANARAHLNLAVLADRAGDAAAAVAHARRVIELDPRELSARNLEALNLVRLGRADEAVASLEPALRFFPASPDLLNNYGSALLQAGRAAEAARQFQRVLDLGRRGAEDHFNLAQACLRSGDISAALAGFAEAVRLEPASDNFHFHHAAALVRSNRLTEAAAAYRTVVRLDPSSVEAWINLGSALHLSGHPTEAMAAFEEALRLAPHDARARERLEAVRAASGAVNP